MLEALRFFWNSTRGYRLRPWKSPYLRWRMETFSGAKADELTLLAMVRTMWYERAQFSRFLGWIREMKTLRFYMGAKGR